MKPLLALAFLTASALAAELQYSVVPNFFELPPGGQPLGPCHGGAVLDRAGNIYITTDTARGIVVFSPEGKYLRAFGPAKIHGLELRMEDGVEYLYAARGSAGDVQKLRLDGTVEWTLGLPAESGLYPEGKGFAPCAVTVGPDGSIYVADGYGSNHVLKFDRARKFVKAFGGPGTAEGRFKTCHGIALDARGEKPLLFVCNRNNNRVEHWDLDGNFVRVIQKDLRMPAAVHIRGEYAIVPELQGRVTVLDKTGAIVAQVGDNPEPKQRANFGLPPEQWRDGICSSPHGASMDAAGNLIVSEWSQFGHLHFFRLAK
jgi:DNA-binding beta-propeller fold protein YncE